MRKGMTAIGQLVGRLQAASGPTTIINEEQAGKNAPWRDPRVREILGPTAVQHTPMGSKGLIFAMDATASREPSWESALQVQASMFSAFAKGLCVQLVYFRGKEFYASPWGRTAAELADQMRGVRCMLGATQIARVLAHAYSVAEHGGAAALVYVGDSMEESSEELADLARKLRSRGVTAFMFQEGSDARAAASFREIAALTRGAYCGFGDQSAAELRDLLSAAAAYATGGKQGLAQLAQQRPAARRLLAQLK
jgi:hypothetical protein